ncbi:hypothetical protein M3Y99_01795400 [Aphelenchoides fujianensis]|nr:hypothetical protein M3Y99_01795400 [Aphelenchoides fujianensis]
MEGQDGGRAFSTAQMNRAVQSYRAKKSARQTAKDEEHQYVEYRKQQILASHRPMVGALRSGDDAFPKRRRAPQGFGQRKAHFLSIRPNPKYAQWFGKKKGTIEAKPQPAATPALVTDHSAVPEPRPAKMVEDPSSTKVSDTNVPDETKPAANAAMSTRPVEKKGNRAENPLDNGVPFWVGAEADEVTDEDLPVDMECLEKVCKGEISLPPRPINKTTFNPYGAIQRFKFDDQLFVRDTALFASTVQCVIALQPDEDAGQYPAQPPIQPLIRWADKINVTVYDPLDRTWKGEEAVVEDLKDIKREKK